MSHIVTVELVNQFLPQDKLEITPATNETLHDYYSAEQLENTIWDIALAKLYTFDTSTWTDANGAPVPTEVPSLILNIVSMWVAGAIYNKQFSEESTDTGDTYGSKLKQDAIALLDGIIEGILKVEELVYVDDASIGQPSTLITEPAFVMEEIF